MRDQALSAAGVVPGTVHSYNVGPGDVCARALVIEAAQSELPENQYGDTLAFILQEWRDFVASNGASQGHGVEGRVFIAAPAVLSFALGVSLPANVSSIERI